MSIASVIYSYFLQALSRYSINYHWIFPFKTHFMLIIIQWMIVILIPLPALITNDIYYRPTFLCWVPKERFLHVLYTLLMYYLIPVLFMMIIYMRIYYQVRSSGKTKVESIRKIQQNRNLEILRNIFILIGIYTCGGIPTLIYITTRIEIFYSIGIIFLSLTVAIERICIMLLDREIRKILFNFCCKTKPTILPIVDLQIK